MSVQLDFFQAKCEIEEKITASSNGAYYNVIHYSKFHWDLNHIEYFGYNGKNYERKECDYTLGELRKHIPQALASVKRSTILRC